MSQSPPAGSLRDQAARPQGRHLLLPHDGCESLAVMAGQCLTPALEDGEAVVLLAEPDHTRRVLAPLSGHGLDIQAAKRAGQLEIIDAAALLAKTTAGGPPTAATCEPVFDRRYPNSPKSAAPYTCCVS